MFQTFRFFSKLAVLFFVGGLVSIASPFLRQGGEKKLSVDAIRQALSPEQVSADTAYSQSGYYSEGGYGASCGCGCCCSCGGGGGGGGGGCC